MGLTRYYDEFTGELVPPMNMANLLGEVLSRKGLRQLRIAEFQKYRHVTSFFNGKLLEPCIAQDSIMVESITIPEDQKPEMSAYEVTDLVLTAVNDGIAAVRKQALAGEKSKLDTRDEGIVDPARLKDTYDVIVLNYANGDMVGHTGVFNAVVKAIEAVDDCVGKVVDAVLKKQGTLLITADHGNAEQMTDPETGAIQTAHSTNLVECVLVGPDAHKYPLIEQGKLSDLAITILDLLGIAIPKEMTAESLLKK
jgi:2,3-bisphosphoglycerate-independent phosphoglycerate mutase